VDQLAGRLNGRLDDKLASNGLNIFKSATETAPSALKENVEPFDDAAADAVAQELAALLSAHEMTPIELGRAKFLMGQHKESRL
jgi:hypothetical protein